MKRYKWFCIHCVIVVIHGFSVSATTNVVRFRPLSPQAEISLITCSPSEDAVFTVYGHTALRVYDPEIKIDRVYNYGIFDFSKPNFIYRFAKGETDYILGTSSFSYFLLEYISRGSEVYEQILNLQQKEKEMLWNALEWNALPENRVYRYNFFFDNCATRPVDMIENNIQGIINYASESELPTFRDIINYCTRERPWQTFGCDLVMGLPTDRTMTQRETFFIPDKVKDAFNNAEIVREGIAEPLVKRINVIAEAECETPKAFSFYHTPLFCASALFFFILLLTLIEWHKKIYCRFVDILLFLAAGMAGCILFFLSFISVHPSIFPNISLLWAHPLHLIGILFIAIKKWKMLAYWYHFINFAVILLMSVGWFFLPQHINIAFIPLIASLWLRSGGTLIRTKNSKG